MRPRSHSSSSTNWHMCLRKNVGSDHEEKATISLVLEVRLKDNSQEKGDTVAETDGHKESGWSNGWKEETNLWSDDEATCGESQCSQKMGASQDQSTAQKWSWYKDTSMHHAH